MGLISRVSRRTYRSDRTEPPKRRTPMESAGVPGTCSRRSSGTRVCQVLLPTCTSTNEATSLTSRVMVPSRRVCHTNATTERLDESTTSPSTRRCYCEQASPRRHPGQASQPPHRARQALQVSTILHLPSPQYRREEEAQPSCWHHHPSEANPRP